MENIVELTTYLDYVRRRRAVLRITTRIHLCFLNYISGLTNDRYIISRTRHSMHAALYSPLGKVVRDFARVLANPDSSRYFHRVLHHPPQSFRPSVR